MWYLHSILRILLGCQWGQPDECVEYVESPMVQTEMGTDLLQYESVYPRAEHSKDEHYCFPTSG